MTYKNIIERWKLNSEANATDIDSRLVTHDATYFSSTNYKIKKIDFYLLIGVTFLLYFLFSIIVTFFNYLNPGLLASNYLAFSITLWLTQTLIPYVLGWALGIYLWFKYKKTFFYSGMFIFLAYIVGRDTYTIPSTIAGTLNVNSVYLNNYRLALQWIDLVYLSIIVIVAISLMPDVWRGLLLIGLPKITLDSCLVSRSEKVKQPRTYPILLYGNKNPDLMILFKILIFIGLVALLTIISGGWNSVGGYISRILRANFSNQSSINESFRSNFFLTALPTYILVVLVAPLVEELSMRHGLMTAGNKNKWTIFISGFLFGLMHTRMDGLATIFPYLLVGLSFAAAYFFFGNYWMVFLAHAIMNSFSFASL